MAIVVAIVGLGLLIAAHEAGHLLLARLMGMRVTTYSLGFGPRIAGFRHGETDYRLSALPLGGYCKIAGFTPDDPAAQDPNDSGSYMNKPAWRRFLVIAAGPGVNYFVAFVIIALLYMTHGFLDLTTTRIAVIADGPAAAAGMQTSDQVVAVDGVPINSFEDLRRELQKSGAPPERTIDVLRGGSRQTIHVRPKNGTISVRLDQVRCRAPRATSGLSTPPRSARSSTPSAAAEPRRWRARWPSCARPPPRRGAGWPTSPASWRTSPSASRSSISFPSRRSMEAAWSSSASSW